MPILSFRYGTIVHRSRFNRPLRQNRTKRIYVALLKYFAIVIETEKEEIWSPPTHMRIE